MKIISPLYRLRAFALASQDLVQVLGFLAASRPHRQHHPHGRYHVP